MRIERWTVWRGGEIQVELEYGTEDADGNFVPRSKTPTEEVIIRDRAAYGDAAVTHNAPSTRADPLDQAASDVLGYIDSNGKWPSP